MPNLSEETRATIERLAKYDVIDIIEPRGTWRDETIIDTTYGQWVLVKNPKAGDLDGSEHYALPRYCSGSDYNGSLVEVSNYKAMLEMMHGETENGERFEYEEGREYITYSGGYGTFALVIRLDSLTEEILETLSRLGDYPLIDESLHSELELEAQNEAWESWAKSDFQRELGRAMFAMFEASAKSIQRQNETDSDYKTRLEETEEFLQDDCGEISDANLTSIFWKMADFANVYWENEEGSSMSIDIERIVKDGLTPSRLDSDWRQKTFGELTSEIKAAMSDRKYDIGLYRYIDPNQGSLPFEASHV